MPTNILIKTLMMLLLHINEKDKIVALNVLKEELNDLDLINSNQVTDVLVGNLKTACRLIEDAIEDANHFAKYQKDLRQQRKQLLIGQIRQLNAIKEQYEAKLIELSFERNEIEETNFKAAFDFRLDKSDENEIIVYSNRDKLEQEIISAIENNKTTKKIYHENNLRDFFMDTVSDDKILKLQNEFKNETGKQMAIVIHFLVKFELIRFDNSDRKRTSRKHFVSCFTEKEYKEINSIGNHLDIDEGLKRITSDDKQYIRIKKQLDKIVSSC
ncbi:hypothetical protein [Aquimarina macrocephali]|uniref:hypothetical protein n=1 Tax=Aquimarina macrocephali TaxID=666563 RepID=UPI0004643A20|nr:hypothetical protein [Aquimarina macrocephali]